MKKNSLTSNGNFICNRCNTEKPLDSYNKASDKSLGIASHCRKCEADRKKAVRYGLSNDSYSSLLAASNHGCCICGTTSRLCVDHNHSTGKVRGILCTNCNAGIGMFNDNESLMKQAIQYLRERV